MRNLKISGLALSLAVGPLGLGGGAALADQFGTNINIFDPGQGTCSSTTVGYCYEPASYQGSAGTEIRWVNNSGRAHNVVRCTAAECQGQDGGSGTDSWTGSGQLQPGDIYAHTFNGLGRYRYYCSIHTYAQMHGEVNVSSVPTPTPSPPPSPTPRPSPSPSPPPSPSPSPSPTPSPSPSPSDSESPAGSMAGGPSPFPDYPSPAPTNAVSTLAEASGSPPWTRYLFGLVLILIVIGAWGWRHGWFSSRRGGRYR